MNAASDYLNNFVAFQNDTTTLQPYQALVKYTIIPQNADKRFLLKFGVGLGKTYSAILVLNTFVQQRLGACVVTYQQDIFRRELDKFKLNIPIDYFGYIEFGNHLVNEGRVNKQLVKSLYNGVVVFDEIQKCYNRANETLTFKYLLFLHLLMRNRVTFVYLSATPLTYAEEIRDFLTLMQDSRVYPDASDYNSGLNKIMEKLQSLELKINKQDREQFVDAAIQLLRLESDIQPTTEITDQLVQDVCRDHVFFVPELIGSDVPSVEVKGYIYNAMPNLRLEMCPSPQSFKADREQQSQLDDQNSMQYESLRHIQFDRLSAQDIARGLANNNEQIVDWCKKRDIHYQNGKLVGSFLQVGTLQHYSPKFDKLIQYILAERGKSFIYFNTIKTFGTDLICSALRENGLLEYGESPQLKSICFECRHTAEQHVNNSKSESTHQFVPFRFFRITGEEGDRYNQALDLFNSPTNERGKQLAVVVGSRRTVQGYNFIAVNNVYIMSFPYNIPDLIQVMGRAIRNRSHVTLPVEHRFVNIHFLVNGFPESIQDISNASREELDIYNKYIDHQSVLHYEQLMHRVAIDVPVYGARYINTNEKQAEQTALKFLPISHERAVYKPFQVQSPRQLIHGVDGNVDMRKYYISSIARDILDQIKRILENRFAESVIWHTDALIDSIRKVPVYPTLQGIARDSILSILLADRRVHLIGDYACYSSEVKQLEASGTRQIIKGDSQDSMPDVDFFMPLAGLRLTPMSLVEKDDIGALKMTEIAQHISNKTPLYMYCLLKGTLHSALNEHYFGNLDIKFITNAITQVATGPHRSRYITREFIPFDIPICPKHELTGVNMQQSVSDVCKQCIRVQQAREQLCNNVDVHKIIFTFLTHTVVLSQTQTVLGYLSQDHRQLYRFQTQTWQQTDDFRDGVSPHQLYIRLKGLTFKTKLGLKSESGARVKYQCPGMQTYVTKNIANLLGFQETTSCNLLVERVKIRELFYRFNFRPQKLVVWSNLE